MNDITRQAVSCIGNLRNVKKNSQTLAAAQAAVMETFAQFDKTAGATREEIADALGVAVLMGGRPGMIYASHAIDAVDRFLKRMS